MTAQGVPFVAVNLEPVFGSIDTYVALIEDAVRRLERATGRPPVVVAHSMGGLVLRRWWAEDGGDRRVHHAITIGTPHRGTWLARFAFSHNGREMRQTSAWLQALGQRENPQRAARTSPASTATATTSCFRRPPARWPGADNRHIPGTAHVHMADRPEPRAELWRWLRPPG